MALSLHLTRPVERSSGATRWASARSCRTATPARTGRSESPARWRSIPIRGRSTRPMPAAWRGRSRLQAAVPCPAGRFASRADAMTSNGARSRCPAGGCMCRSPRSATQATTKAESWRSMFAILDARAVGARRRARPRTRGASGVGGASRPMPPATCTPRPATRSAPPTRPRVSPRASSGLARRSRSSRPTTR